MNYGITSHPPELEPLPRTAPRPGSNARVWAGGFLILAGLGIVAIGFIFFVLALAWVEKLTWPGNARPDESVVLLVSIILGSLALASFAGAGLVLFLGIRGLVRIMQEKPTQN